MTEVGIATLNPPSGPSSAARSGARSPASPSRCGTTTGPRCRRGRSGGSGSGPAAARSGTGSDPAASAAIVRDGWLDSGDLARADEDGYLWFFGRKKQIIVHDGSNISPQEVEGALLEHPRVALAGVVGVDDAVHGESVRAYVTLDGEGAAPDARRADRLRAGARRLPGAGGDRRPRRDAAQPDRQGRPRGAQAPRRGSPAPARPGRRALTSPMAMARDYYEVLGVPRDASEDDIKRAFRSRAGLHPDVNADPQAEARFKELAQAYRPSPTPRRGRPTTGTGPRACAVGPGPEFADFGSFQDLFDASSAATSSAAAPRARAPGRRRRRGRADLVRRVGPRRPREVEYDMVGTCAACEGLGAAPGADDRALRDVRRPGPGAPGVPRPFGQFVRAQTCPQCRGAGDMPSEAARPATGGRAPDHPSQSVDIPAGIADGQRIRMSGRGGAGERARAPATSTCRCRWPRTRASRATASTS